MSIKREVIEERLESRKTAYGKLMDAYIALLDGGVQSYAIDKRTLTKLDLGTIKDQMNKLESEIDSLEAMLEGRSPRKAVGIVPRNW